MVQHDSLNFVELNFWSWCCSTLSLSPLRRAFERRLAYDQIHQSLPCYCLLLMLLTKTFVNEFFLWNKIMCFLVFTSHSSLLLFHVNNILSTTFAHKTTTWRILRWSFLPKPYIILYVFKDILWDLQREYKNKNRVDICPKQMHFENSSDSLNRYTYTYKTWKKKRQQRQTTLWQTTLWGDSKVEFYLTE